MKCPGGACAPDRGREGANVPTQAKVAAVEALTARFGQARTVVLTEYRGLTVQQLGELRRQLRAVSARYQVVKNRLARRAAVAAGLEALSPFLRGPTGVVLGANDPVAVARTLATFSRSYPALTMKAGVVEGQPLDGAGLRALAELPPRDQLRAQLIGALQGPLTLLVQVLQAPLRELVATLEARGRQGGDS